VVDDLPVLDLGMQPEIPQAQWSLRLAGEIENPCVLDWAAFQALPQIEVVVDIHCVTRWSRLDVPWLGVAAAELLKLARPKPTARFVVLHAADGYTTNLPLELFQASDVVLAHQVDGKPLPRDHGGPARLVVPSRYFWKSAKWITEIHFHAEDHPGFWEVRGYHNAADPFKEERFSS
jgi:DMSO/TMAO reductase YedYZ molybdopterin-dependent catalytic subunit